MKKNTKNFLVRTLVVSASLPIIGPAVIRGMNRVMTVMARFDSAFQGWGERSWIFQSLQDAWLEIDTMSRMELQRISDYLVENSPIVWKIRCLKLQFSVGFDGLKIIPDSSDDGFNDARTKSWEAWWSKPELGCDTSGAQLTRVWAGLLFDKGEIIIYKTKAKVKFSKGMREEPRIQTIDAHRLKTPPTFQSDPKTGFPIIDGIVVNPDTGERVAYWVKRSNFSQFVPASQGQTTEEYDRLDAANVIHKFKVRRPGQMRGIPEGSSVFNLVRDNMDLHKMEMQCAKLNTEIAQVETNPSGELDTFTNRKQKLNIQTQNAAGTSVQKNSWANYNVSFGGKKIAMQTGSKLADFMINRPSLVQQQYWDLHYTLICMGYDVPKLLVMPYSLQGTVTRADLDICANAFRVDFALIREICEDIYEWESKWDVEYNTNLKSPAPSDKYAKSRYVMDKQVPDDTEVCLIRPPRSPNVDIGYTAKALEIEVRLGVKNMQGVYADKNEDWRIETRQIAEYVAYVQELEKEFKLQPGQITSLTTPQPIQDPTSKPDAPEGDTKESTPA